ncbi:transposase [Capsulimonas corticalis]|uniref:Transposase n=1 Tax=Capsulimonas corticalis TaxID=2219043 RepID=A0A402CV84_9BACT|nr:IS200/IS605 family transposase [Capsulimonas corticalis]BDI30319.1 transposase [Capsulimonas corticalis]
MDKRNNIEVFVHYVWTTDQRHPFLMPDIENRVHRCIANECVRLNCKVLSIGGMPDHVHLAVSLPTTVTIAKVMHQVKGISSQFIKNELRPDEYFAWREGYAAFSFGRTHLKAVVNYIENQKEHHGFGKIWPAVELGEYEPDDNAS